MIIEKLDLKQNVQLVGNKPKAILEIAKTEIFAFPSRFEGMPNALLEAMSCGLPCISADCIAGPSEIIQNGINGILIEVDNVNQLTEKIIYLIENKDIAQKIGEEAKKVNDTFSTDTIFNNYYNYFKEINSIKK